MKTKMKVAILGGRKIDDPVKLGDYLAWWSKVYDPVVLGRDDCDFSDVWVPVFKNALIDKFGETDGVPNSPNLIILTAFDNHGDKLGMQENMLRTLWEIYKDNAAVQIVVIGSMAWQYGRSDPYALAKKSLAQRCLQLSHSAYKCSLHLLEPACMENARHKPLRVLKFFEVAKVIDNAYQNRLPYIHTSLVGKIRP